MTEHRNGDNVNKKEINMNIKKFRNSKNMSQQALAKASGVAQSTIWYIESGQKNPSITTAIKIADALGVDLETLIKS